MSGAIGDSVDGFVTGFELGEEGKGFESLVGALHISIYLEDSVGNKKLHHIARCANIPLETRKKITVEVNGKLELHSSVYNKVVEIEGQAISARALRLTHPRILRFRTDKNPEQCVMRKEDLARLVL